MSQMCYFSNKINRQALWALYPQRPLMFDTGDLKLSDLASKLCLFKLILSKFWRRLSSVGLGLGTHIFVKVSRPGNSEVTFSVFESSCHILLPI